jgi:tetrapyrrole methylase family protein/MazG family protein
LARRVQENASVVGFDWEDMNGPRDKLNEEIEELDCAIKERDKKED